MDCTSHPRFDLRTSQNHEITLFCRTYIWSKMSLHSLTCSNHGSSIPSRQLLNITFEDSSQYSWTITIACALCRALWGTVPSIHGAWSGGWIKATGAVLGARCSEICGRMRLIKFDFWQVFWRITSEFILLWKVQLLCKAISSSSVIRPWPGRPPTAARTFCQVSCACFLEPQLSILHIIDKVSKNDSIIDHLHLFPA